MTNPPDLEHDSAPKTPNPGSTEAIKAGCTCPVIDNHHGKGVPVGDLLHREFWITEGCPLHAAKAEGGAA